MPASSIYIYFTQVYYRLHVSVFKLLMRQPQDAPYDVILAYLKEAAEGPFATGGERKRYVLFCWYIAQKSNKKAVFFKCIL